MLNAVELKQGTLDKPTLEPAWNYRFDVIEVDRKGRFVRREGRRVALTEKLFELLLTFLERPGVALRRQELLERVWPNCIVEDGNLSVSVSLLRRALGDTRAQSRYLETVPRWGYRFIGLAHPRAPGHGCYSHDGNGCVGSWRLCDRGTEEAAWSAASSARTGA